MSSKDTRHFIRKYSLQLGLIAFLSIAVLPSFQTVFAQTPIYINDVFYDRLFRRTIVETAVKVPDSIRNNGKPPMRGGWEASTGKNQAFGLVMSAPALEKVTIDGGIMIYNLPFEGIDETSNYAFTSSLGSSYQTKYLRIFAGGMFRIGNSPIQTMNPDTTIWVENVESEANPYLYLNIGNSRLNFSGNVMPDPSFSKLVKFGLYTSLNLLDIKNLAYIDRIQTPIGDDYDIGYEFKYIFEDKYSEEGQENAFAKLRIGNAFRLSEGESLQDNIDDNSNRYVLAELAYWWVGGLSYHNTHGRGWRIGVDYGMKGVRILGSYQKNYILPTAFAIRPTDGLFLGINFSI